MAEHIDLELACEDCIHYDICIFHHYGDENKKCPHFKNKADVAEVRHGEWVYHECVSSYDGANSGYSCSVCSAFIEEAIFDMDEFNDFYCGACGAKMDGKGEE